MTETYKKVEEKYNLIDFLFALKYRSAISKRNIYLVYKNIYFKNIINAVLFTPNAL